MSGAKKNDHQQGHTVEGICRKIDRDIGSQGYGNAGKPPY